MRVSKNFKVTVILSAIISLVCFITGILVSFVYATPVGATVVISNLVIFIIFSIISKIKTA